MLRENKNQNLKRYLSKKCSIDLTCEDLQTLVESMRKRGLVISMNKELNSKLFEHGVLKEDIRQALIHIADTFVDDIKDNNIPIDVMDYWLVGSNASYNYSDQSDIDIHIIADMDDVDCNGLLPVVYNYAKSDFNKNHNITVKGIPVEVYIESKNASAITNGIYSLMNNDWVKYPDRIVIDTGFNPATSDQYKTKEQQVNDALNSDNLEKIQQAIDSLYLLRKASLATDGEFGEGNLIFKEFRNNGTLDKLKERKRELVDKDLTLEKLEKRKDSTIQMMPGDPVKGMAFFNSAMGMGEQLKEAEESSKMNKTYRIDKEHDIHIDGDQVFISYDDLNYERRYKLSNATRWEPEVWDYDDVVIRYDYQTDLDDFLWWVWDTLVRLDAVDENVKAGDEDSWLIANMDDIMKDYGSDIIETFREQAEKDAEESVDPEDTYPEPPEYDD